MDLDREIKTFSLTHEEVGLLGLHPSANLWPFEGVGELADAVSEATVRTHDIDPSSEPAGARRNALIEQKTRKT